MLSAYPSTRKITSSSICGMYTRTESAVNQFLSICGSVFTSLRDDAELAASSPARWSIWSCLRFEREPASAADVAASPPSSLPSTLMALFALEPSALAPASGSLFANFSRRLRYLSSRSSYTCHVPTAYVNKTIATGAE